MSVLVWILDGYQDVNLSISIFGGIGIDGRTIERGEKGSLVIILQIVSHILASHNKIIGSNAMGWCQVLLGWNVKLEDTLWVAVPVVRNRCNTMMEVFIIVLEDDSKLNQTLGVDLPLMSIWNLYICDKSHSDWHCLSWDNPAHLSARSWPLGWVQWRDTIGRNLLGSQLNDLILESGIPNLMTCDLSELINCCNVGLLNLKFYLNMTSICLLGSWSCLWPTHNLKSVSHVRSDQEIVRNDFQKREDLYLKHITHNSVSASHLVSIVWMDRYVSSCHGLSYEWES